MFLYDTLLTTSEEIRCFWGRRVTGAAVLFWFNKYLTMLYLVWSIGNFQKMSDDVRVIPLADFV